MQREIAKLKADRDRIMDGSHNIEAGRPTQSLRDLMPGLSA
jgi:hypothetical protein